MYLCYTNLYSDIVLSILPFILNKKWRMGLESTVITKCAPLVFQKKLFLEMSISEVVASRKAINNEEPKGSCGGSLGRRHSDVERNARVWVSPLIVRRNVEIDNMKKVQDLHDSALTTNLLVLKAMGRRSNHVEKNQFWLARLRSVLRCGNNVYSSVIYHLQPEICFGYI